MRAPIGKAAAPDYKFFAFGGHVATVWYVQGRHTPEECSAWCVVHARHELADYCPNIVPTYYSILAPTILCIVLVLVHVFTAC